MNEIKYRYFRWGPFLFHTEVTQEECDMILKEGKKCRRKSNDYRSGLAGHLSEEYKFLDAKGIISWLKKKIEIVLFGKYWEMLINELWSINLINKTQKVWLL